jgi:hypothetical protein
MELSDIQALAEKLAAFKDEDFNEETTKHALVTPFVQMLGYDTCNPLEVRFEYTADFGVKKGDRVDIAILQDGVPTIIIECKPLQANLDAEKRSQLYTYFAASAGTRIGILTNGRQYQFFSDLDQKNLMDSQPFLSFDLLSFDKKLLPALQKLCKDTWDLKTVMDSAGRLKHLGAIKALIRKDGSDPDEDVVRHYAKVCYSGKMTASVIEHFKPLVVQAFRDYINERLQERLAELENPPAPAPEPVSEPEQDDEDKDGIVTHDSEIHGWITVRTLLGGVVEPSRVMMRDRKSYCSILLDGRPTKTICRFYNFCPVADDGSIGKSAFVSIFGKDSEGVRHQLRTVEDLLPYKDELAQAVLSYLEEGK